MSLNTISVIYLLDNSLVSFVSFEDTLEGQEKAKKAFFEKIKQIFPDFIPSVHGDKIFNAGELVDDEEGVQIYVKKSNNLSSFLRK